ncbi:MAG: LysR family transcriptional regulator [Proteobacteria bacterium]|nr:LysR family transcriptional regulator [Pseudomonadota bacterium]
MEIKAKFWVENKGEVVIGSGKAALLHTIREKGSIQKAAEEFGMSYRHAWGIIRKMEQGAGFKFVNAQAGGGEGKGARLTARGKDFLEKFTLFEETLRKVTTEKFREIFK